MRWNAHLSITGWIFQDGSRKVFFYLIQFSIFVYQALLALLDLSIIYGLIQKL